jgi:hypothetical protein
MASQFCRIVDPGPWARARGYVGEADRYSLGFDGSQPKRSLRFKEREFRSPALPISLVLEPVLPSRKLLMNWRKIPDF